MKKRVIIPYEENRDSYILLALGKIREHSDMEFGQIGKLRDLFNDKKDIYYDVPIESLPTLLGGLELSGFVYRLIEIP